MQTHTYNHLIALVRRLAKAGTDLDVADTRLAHQTAEIGKATMRLSVLAFVTACAGTPAARSTSSDGTPISVKSTRHGVGPSGSFVRTGRESHEFLVSHSLYRGHNQTSDTLQTVMNVNDAQPLTWGKSTPAQFEAMILGLKSLRQLGHTGIAVEHYIWDSAGIGALSRQCKQWHSFMAECWGDESCAGTCADMLWLLEWIFVGPCAAHIAQTAFEWGLWSEFHDKDLFRDAYITIEALRNSFDLLVRHLGIWLATVISFVPALDSDAVNDLHELWVTLGLDPDLALHFAETLQLRWQNGRLLVADVIRDCQPTTLVYNAFLAILRLRPFTSSRWLSMGGSARTLVSLLIVGLPDLVRYIRDETGASLFFLNGYDRLTPDVMRLFASVCFVCRPTDAVLLLLLEDGRIARQMQNIRDLSCGGDGVSLQYLVLRLEHRCVGGEHGPRRVADEVHERCAH